MPPPVSQKERLEALEALDELIPVYRRQSEYFYSLSIDQSLDFNERDTHRSAGAAALAVVEKLEHVRSVVAQDMRARRSRKNREERG